MGPAESARAVPLHFGFKTFRKKHFKSDDKNLTLGMTEGERKFEELDS